MKVSNYLIVASLMFVPLAGCQGQPYKSNYEVKSNIEHLTPATFKQKIYDYSKSKEWKFVGDKPCIIDFYATWCGPCKAMAPTINQIAKEYKGKINVYKVDVDAQQELASVFGITSMPTLLFCPSSAKPEISVGLINRGEFDKKIKEILKVSL